MVKEILKFRFVSLENKLFSDVDVKKMTLDILQKELSARAISFEGLGEVEIRQTIKDVCSIDTTNLENDKEDLGRIVDSEALIKETLEVNAKFNTLSPEQKQEFATQFLAGVPKEIADYMRNRQGFSEDTAGQYIAPAAPTQGVASDLPVDSAITGISERVSEQLFRDIDHNEYPLMSLFRVWFTQLGTWDRDYTDHRNADGSNRWGRQTGYEDAAIADLNQPKNIVWRYTGRVEKFLSVGLRLPNAALNFVFMNPLSWAVIMNNMYAGITRPMMEGMFRDSIAFLANKDNYDKAYTIDVSAETDPKQALLDSAFKMITHINKLKTKSRKHLKTEITKLGHKSGESWEWQSGGKNLILVIDTTYASKLKTTMYSQLFNKEDAMVKGVEVIEYDFSTLANEWITEGTGDGQVPTANNIFKQKAVTGGIDENLRYLIIEKDAFEIFYKYEASTYVPWANLYGVVRNFTHWGFFKDFIKFTAYGVIKSKIDLTL